MAEKMYDLVIVGGPGDCWWLALLLAKQLNVLTPKIAVISLMQGNDKAAIVSTSSSIRRFHKLLGVSEKDLVRRSIVRPVLGVDISASEPARQFFHSYGSNSSEPIDVDWPVMAARLGYNGLHPDDLSLAATMARSGKFIDPERVPHTVYQSLGVGLNLHLVEYVDLLREQAMAMGVVEFKAQTVSYTGTRSVPFIDLLRLDSQHEISAALFIDLSSAGLQDDNAASALAINIASIQCNGIKNSGGVATRMLVRDRKFYSLVTIASTSCMHYYNVQPGEVPSLTEDVNVVISNAWDLCLGLSGEKTEQINRFNFNDAACWKGNCVRIPPATNTPWDMLLGYGEITRQGMVRLLDCYASPAAMSGASEEFNRLSLLATKEYQQLMVIFLMLTSALSDEQLQSLVEPAIYEEALHSINLFKSSAVVSSYLSPLLSRDQWVNLFIGFGVVPATGGICFDSIDIENMNSMATQRRAQVNDASDKSPLLNEYINYFLKT